MALAALISATHEAREPGVALRATFWLAGRTVIERQARLAAGAGAALVIILVESLPAELVQAVERLRGEGMLVVTARNAAEAAAAVSPGMKLMMIGDGFVGDKVHVERLLADGRPVLLAVADRGFDDRFERLDGDLRWAGLALIDADLLRDVAMMPADWSVQSTLLRRAMQTGVRAAPLTDEREAAELAMVERRQDFAELQRRILAGASAGPRNWASRYLLAPVERAAAGALMTGPVGTVTVGIAAMVLAFLAAFAFHVDWRWTGLALIVLSLPLEGIALRLARLRLQRLGPFIWWRAGAAGGAALALVALGDTLAVTHGWGTTLLAFVAIAFLIALRPEQARAPAKAEAVLANLPSLVVVMVPFALAGWWAFGLACVALYAAASFFHAQHLAHRPGLASD